MHSHEPSLPVPFLFFLLLLTLIPITLSPLHPQLPSPDPKQTLTRNNFIVRFRDYKIAADHRAYLEANLRSPLEMWRWIERKNPASEFPTDFGVVEIRDSDQTMIEEIERLERVKDVSVDSSYSRSLFVDTTKRPGKMFTAMSFEEGMEDERMSNMTRIDLKRKILMEVSI